MSKPDITIHQSNFSHVYLANGKYLTVEVTDSVGILVYNRDTRQIMLVNQARHAMRTAENPTGKITELTAGRFDCNKTPTELMADELFEEAGISVDPQEITLVTEKKIALCAGLTTEHIYLGFVIINNQMMEAEEKERGVGEDERVSRVWIDAHEFMHNYEPEDVRVMLMQLWFKSVHTTCNQGGNL